jgi:RNA polymerase sigma-70 factor, ECF subfamily
MKKEFESEYNHIVEQYHDVVRGFVGATVRNPWIADDLTQETFVKAYNGLRCLEDMSKVKSWLMRIAHNVCLDYFKSVSRNKCDSIEIFEEVFSAKNLPVGKQLERNEMSCCVQEKMLLLPRSYRIILILFDIVGLTHCEISEVLGIKEGNVKVRLHRARIKMKDILNEHCTFESDERDILTCAPK